MNNQRWYRANSCIRARKERTENRHKNSGADAHVAFQISTMSLAPRCSFLTIPNTFKQCTISLLIIHSAISKCF